MYNYATFLPSPEKTEAPGKGERVNSENSEQELKNLMQQTDDAKVEEKITLCIYYLSAYLFQQLPPLSNFCFRLL